LYQLCLTIWDEARHGNPLGPMFGDCAHLALAAGLLRRAGRHGKAQRETHKPYDRELKRIQAYVDERLDQPISLRDVASVVGLSQQSFTRALKEASGLSPHQYLITRRLDIAKQLLLDPARSVAEIASDSGLLRPGPHDHYLLASVRLYARPLAQRAPELNRSRPVESLHEI
jgi:AraC family transcriptional regulator